MNISKSKFSRKAIGYLLPVSPIHIFAILIVLLLLGWSQWGNYQLKPIVSPPNQAQSTENPPSKFNQTLTEPLSDEFVMIPPSLRRYRVKLGTFSNKESASQEANRLHQWLTETIVIEQQNNLWVLLSHIYTRKEKDIVLSKLRKSGISPQVISVSTNENSAP